MAFELRFHCTSRLRKSGKKSKHQVMAECDAVKSVLKLNPERGLPIPKFGSLRKMRVGIPNACLGKSGGYRLIYRQVLIDEVVHVMLLETYFKGDHEDLPHDQYNELLAESESILNDPSLVPWEG